MKAAVLFVTLMVFAAECRQCPEEDLITSGFSSNVKQNIAKANALVKEADVALNEFTQEWGKAKAQLATIEAEALSSSVTIARLKQLADDSQNLVLSVESDFKAFETTMTEKITQAKQMQLHITSIQKP
ncbi:hypothetical protein PoB_006652000 [Plakobranchus ocellatus]|uniref:Apolipophorin-III n=1 Tax=Plakobranchus ocellatus TaxID=259542 RepID=A0AAV4D7C2_9GAST|nr:hypothetical protein PoB_006652000 [Plakobranchus ocellatus]